MKATLFLICFQIAFVFGGTCAKYICGPSNQTACASYSVSERNVTISFNQDICTSSQKCRLDIMKCVDIPPDSNRFPGRKCSASSECLGNNCLNGVCKGLSVGTSCTLSLYCDVGLFCSSGKCAALLPSGSNCSQDNDCTYGFGCHFFKCFPWGTIPNGGITDPKDCISFVSKYCSSGQCHSNGVETVCIPGATYSSGDLVICNSFTDCVGKSESYYFNEKCGCGFNPTGTSYCSVLMGSSYGVNYWAAMAKWFNSTAAQSCHKAEDPKNSLKDYGSKSDYLNLAHYQLWVTAGSYIKGMQSCMLNSAFPETKDYFNIGFGYAVLASLGVLVII